MPRKRVAIAAKPADKPSNLNDWVETPRVETESVTSAAPKKEKTKRLTLDIPESLHRAIKSESVSRGVSMVEMLREDLMQKYGSS